MALTLDATGLLDITKTYQVDKTAKLEKTLKDGLDKVEDHELKEACESFEKYFVEMVIKEMKKTVHSSEENEYTQMFADTLNQEYAKDISKTGNLGIAQMLYESMKRR